MIDLYKTFSKSTICVSYLGASDDGVLVQLIQLAESYVNHADGLKKLSKKVSFLIAESFQNVARHGSRAVTDSNQNSEEELFQIIFFPDRVVISTVNTISQVEVAELNKKIDSINILNKEDLKQLSRKTLANASFSNKGGAGLGLIEIARKTGMPLKKSFVDIDKNSARFFLGMEVVKKDVTTDSSFDLNVLEEQYNSYLKNGVIIQYNGHFNKETTAPIIEILAQNFIDENKMESNIIENVTIIIEIVQNASKHGLAIDGLKEGFLSVQETNGNQSVRCGNYISFDAYKGFVHYLDGIKAMSVAELRVERNRKMLEDSISEDGNGSLGLLEIALFSQNTFEYSFKKMTNGNYFYSIELNLKKNG